jgi:Cu/Ag efflux protein CusF
MESMTMEFPVKNPDEFSKLQVGQQIRATLCQTQRGLDFWLEGIVVEK